MKKSSNGNMIRIVAASENQFEIIQDIAKKTWPTAYGNVISVSQIEYMLDMMYSLASLKEQSDRNHHFILAEDEDFVGFASYEFDCNEKGKTKIHKLYVLPDTQTKGIGNKLVSFISEEALRNNQKLLFLNVNKMNSAQSFYKKNGFAIVCEEVIDIGDGYVMDDFIMEKSL